MRQVTRSPILPTGWTRHEWVVPLIVLGICSLTGWLSSVRFDSPLWMAIVTVNLIGFSQYGLSMLMRIPLRGRMPAWCLVLAIAAGYLLGNWMGSRITGAPNMVALMFDRPAEMRQFILTDVIIGMLVASFFLFYSHSRSVRDDLERERRRVAEALQAETAARLALLQAQIEPHFLFNTLAHIHSLIKQDPDTACLVLEQLDACLRTSLRRTRQSVTTLGEELELIEALLGIASARMGKRLDYTISVPASLRSAPLPPLLLQPLVENAIRHGIEPDIQGGSICIEAARKDDALELTVKDTGAGLNEQAPQGVGLGNIRARLASLYGGKGRLEFYTNAPRGVVARLIVPMVVPMPAKAAA